MFARKIVRSCWCLYGVVCEGDFNENDLDFSMVSTKAIYFNIQLKQQ